MMRFLRPLVIALGVWPIGAFASDNPELDASPAISRAGPIHPARPVVTLEEFGCVPNTTSVDNTDCINRALAYLQKARGGEIKVSNNSFYYNGPIQWLGNQITMSGTGYASQLIPGLSGTFRIGTAVNVEGKKTGVDVLYPKIRDLSFTAVKNYGGSILQVLDTEHTDIDTVNFSVADNDGSTQTNGLFLKWVQYTRIRNIHTFVNGYAIWIYLDNASPWNEDHYAIDNSSLILDKTPMRGSYPAGIAIQRVAGRRGAAIGQFSVTNTLFYQNVVSDFSNTNGVLTINDRSAFNTTVLQNGTFTTDMFENVYYPFNETTLATNDTSLYDTKDCYFLQNMGTVFYGSDILKTEFVADSDFFLQGGTLVGNARVFFNGFNHQSAMKRLFSGDVAFNRFAYKTGLALNDVILQNSSYNQAVGPSATSITIAHGLYEAPAVINVTPSWNTNFWVTKVGATTFTINFSNAPAGKGGTIYWFAQVYDR